MVKKKPKKKNKLLYISNNEIIKIKFFVFFKDEFFAPVPQEIIERLVTRPEDMSPDVGESIQLYKDQLLRMFEEYMASLPQSYLIELDGNMSPTILFEQLLERLNAYAIRRAALVQRFFPPEEEEEEIPHETNEMGMNLYLNNIFEKENSYSF